MENKGSFSYYLWNKISFVYSFEKEKWIIRLNQSLTLKILLFTYDKGFQWSSFTCILLLIMKGVQEKCIDDICSNILN